MFSIVAKWRHMVTSIWINIGWGNNLLPDSNKPSSEPILPHRVFCVIQLRAISQEVLMNLFSDICSEIALKELLLHIPGVDELKVI